MKSVLKTTPVPPYDLLGLERCGELVAEETRLAKEAVEGLDGSGFLCRLADTLADRRM